MDPFAHTLVGAGLAATGLRKQTRYATAALIIGANLPDIDVLATFWGEDSMLYHRRGWTHGILALVVLPMVLAGLIALWQRLFAKPRPDTPAFRFSVLLALCYLAVATHPLLDWLNTYGVRLLMPFDDTWFYGDTLFIIDPWLWLLPLAAVMFGWHASNRVRTGATVFALAASIMVLSTHLTPLLVKLLWSVLVAGLLVAVWRGTARDRGPLLAQACLALMVAYIGSTWTLARQAETHAANAAAATPLQVQANPLPGTPLAHRLVLVFDDHYLLQTPDGNEYRVERPPANAVVKAALASPEVRGFVTWMRFPYWDVEETASGWLVHLYDLRYQGPDDPTAGIGYAQVALETDDVRDAAASQGQQRPAQEKKKNNTLP
ncbi:MAG: metal-dependent hydrolase [Alcanivoracaceae bacterium]|nr:metal-dependent hydrolase [Alcanivoracaceae bacterium]